MLLGLKNWQKGEYFEHLAGLKLAMVIRGRARINHNCSNRPGPVISAWELKWSLTVVMVVSNGRCPRGDSRLGLVWEGKSNRYSSSARVWRSSMRIWGKQRMASWSSWRIAAILSLHGPLSMQPGYSGQFSAGSSRLLITIGSLIL